MKSLKIVAIALISFWIIAAYFNISFADEMREKHGSVCITRTGEKYHACYHYSGRNFSISLFDALSKGYDPCKVCNSPNTVNFELEDGYPNWFFRHYVYSSLILLVVSVLVQQKIESSKSTT